MSPDSPSRNDLIAYLRAQIKERQERKGEIDRSIHVLEEAAHELQRQLDAIYPALEETASEAEDIPYRISRTPEKADAPAAPKIRTPEFKTPEPEEETPRGEEAQERDAAFSLDADAEKALPAAVEEKPEPAFRSPPAASAMGTDLESALQEGQHLLLDGRRKSPAPGANAASGKEPRNGKHVKNIAPPEVVSDLDLDEDVALLFKNPRRKSASPLLTADALDFPVAEKPASDKEYEEKTVPPPPPPAKTAVAYLKNYIRAGGAVRCLDPWNRTCAAFVLRQGDGPAILATDAFLTYLRRATGQLAQTGEAAAAASNDVEKQKDFLADLMGALMQEDFEALKHVPSLQISGAKALPRTFEFETASITIMHTRVLSYLQNSFQKPIGEFFAPEGPYSEIQEYLERYREFTLERSEEARTASLLSQAGLPFSPAGGRTASAGRGIDPNAMSSYSASFVKEGENLQDLNTFDYTPEDQKVILSQKEDALSASMFKKLGPENPFLGKPQPGEEGGKDLSPAAQQKNAEKETPKKKNGEKAEDMEQMLKDLGIDWKD
ncbi:MAG: hypothetical protein O2807_05245 [bacterium]|nr:hypothetical protein [bacterium]